MAESVQISPVVPLSQLPFSDQTDETEEEEEEEEAKMAANH